MHTNLTTVAGLAYELRNQILGYQHEGAGALTFLITAAAALQTRAARLAPACELCGAPAVLVGEQWVCGECSPLPPTPAAPVAPRGAQLVPSESEAGLFYIVRNFGESCTCPGFRFRHDCKHARRAREERRAQLRALISRATAAVMARPLVAA